jgi:hypothetical protein
MRSLLRFKNGMHEGEGFMTLPGGRTLKGRFQYSAVFERTYTYADGKVFTGQCNPCGRLIRKRQS